MPIYTYQCDICESITEEYRTVANRHESPFCDCGHSMGLKIVPTQIAPVLGGGDFPGYQCPVTDEFITSRRKRRYVMESNNLVEVGDRSPSKKRREQTEKNIENGIV